MTSRRNGLVTVYDVSRTEGHPVQSKSPPYYLTPLHLEGKQRPGHTFFHHPADNIQRHITMLQLSDLGSVGLLNLECLPYDDKSSPFPRSTTTKDSSWSEDIQWLKDEADANSREVGTFGGRSMTEVDLRPAYLSKIFIIKSKSSLISLRPVQAGCEQYAERCGSSIRHFGKNA